MKGFLQITRNLRQRLVHQTAGLLALSMSTPRHHRLHHNTAFTTGPPFNPGQINWWAFDLISHVKLLLDNDATDDPKSNSVI